MSSQDTPMERTYSHAWRIMLTATKIAIALAILTWLVIQGQDSFAELSKGSINWRFLAAALMFSLATAAFNFMRWHLLIRALDINIRLIDTFRLGALGFTLNFVSPGSIGGDFFKAIFLARGQAGKRTEAVASVVADRVIGLLTLLALATGGILATGLLQVDSPSLHLLCETILFMAVTGWTGFGLVMLLRVLTGPAIRARVEPIPVVGRTIARLLAAISAFRTRKRMLLAAFAVSSMMAICLVTTFYLVSRGLHIRGPSWAEHLVIVPAAGLVGALPITPSGVGTTELALEELYKRMPGGADLPKGHGTLVGFGRRFTDIVVALAGLGFYLRRRREVNEVFAEVENAAI